jgi:tetratricopeptide (TPR) repeat protein
MPTPKGSGVWASAWLRTVQYRAGRSNPCVLVSADKPSRRKRSKAKFPKMNFFVNVISRLAGLVWLTVCLTANALAAPVPASPNVILITLDTTRADRMGFLGSKLGLTPNLDALARDSAVFTRAYAQAPLTTTSHATILTGTYPQYHLVNAFGIPLAADLPYAPEILRAHGYRTAAFVGSIILNPNEPYAPGFDRGFETYDAGFHNEGPGQDRYRTVQRRGDEVLAHALAWLKQHPKGPFFVWVHLYDAHDPYDPPEPYKTRYAAAPYDGAVAYEDAVVGKLLRQLKLRGLYDGAVVAVTADHGESLGALDPAAQEKLGALGYMAGSRDDSEKSAADQGADPKDKIELANMIHRAEVLQQDMHSDESIALIEQVIAKEPGLPLNTTLGEWLMAKHDFQKAVTVLRKAMQMDPDSPMTHFQLAKSLMATGDFAASVPELEFAVAKMPGFADAHLFLETAYARTNRVPETIKECKIVLQFLPDHFGSYLILGRFLEISGDFEGAVPKLKKAAALEPKAPEPHMFLADAYDQLGQKAAAAQERAIAKRLSASGAQ